MCGFEKGAAGRGGAAVQVVVIVLTTATIGIVSAALWERSPQQAGDADSSSGCPDEVPEEPGPNARQEAIAAAEEAIPTLYSNIDTEGYEVTDAYPADVREGFAGVAHRLCGSSVGERSWVVELRFPREEPSASVSQGQLFLARFSDGWRVWERYH